MTNAIGKEARGEVCRDRLGYRRAQWCALAPGGEIAGEGQVAADRKVDWKLLTPLVGGKSARFATDEELRSATGLSKGAVPPLGSLFGLRAI
jgi:aminoacyl-tRNA editing protein